MWVYIVTLEGAYGTQISGVFTSRTKADYHAEEMNKQYSAYCFEVKEYFAV
jgi:hypothetical protein